MLCLRSLCPREGRAPTKRRRLLCVQKGDFIGRSELLRLKESHAELTRRCVHLIMREHDTERDPFLHGDEPIYRCATTVRAHYECLYLK